MGEDGLTYSEAVRTAAAEAGAALGIIREAAEVTPQPLPEAVRERVPRAHPRPGNRGKARTLLDIDAEKRKPAPRKLSGAQPADARMITTFEACISDLRSMLASAQERSLDERTRCDRVTAEAMSANARAAHLEGELAALRSSIATLETCISDLRSRLASAEERSTEERTRCDRATTEAMSANARAAHLEGELAALRSHQPWWGRLIRRRTPAGP